jgi:lipopolysaccharide export LptBFGC system permease protein LptF
MVAIPSLPVGSTFLGEIILIALIAIVLFIIFKLGKAILKLLFGIIANSILGLIAIFVLNYFLNLGIPIELATMVPTAIFGLPAVGTLVILRFFGVPL